MSSSSSLSSTITSAWLKPFLAGILTTLATIQLRRITTHFTTSKTHNPNHRPPKDNSDDDDDDDDDNNESLDRPKGTDTKTIQNTILMDSPQLDQRMIRKAEAAILKRTSRLIIVVERCTNDHNYSAILRTAEALGVQNVYIIAPQCINPTLFSSSENDEHENCSEHTATTETTTTLHRSTGQIVKSATQHEVENRAQHHLFAQRALEWIDVREFATTAECITALRDAKYEIWSTDLGQVADCLTVEGLGRSPTSGDGDGGGTVLPPKLAIVFGTEAVGCTTEILNASDRRVYLPLRGFADSLNLSVATALIVHQLFVLDPTLAGATTEEERLELRKRWYGKLAGQRLVTKAEKTARKRLVAEIRRLEGFERKLLLWTEQEKQRREQAEEKKEATTTTAAPTPPKTIPPLTKEQTLKLSNLPTLRTNLGKIDSELRTKAARAVQGLVENPPEPLGDMRRADEHRATFVGKKTKKKYGKEWADMPATSYYNTEGEGGAGGERREGEGGSAAFFRGRLRDLDAGDGDGDGC